MELKTFGDNFWDKHPGRDIMAQEGEIITFDPISEEEWRGEEVKLKRYTITQKALLRRPSYSHLIKGVVKQLKKRCVRARINPAYFMSRLVSANYNRETRELVCVYEGYECKSWIADNKIFGRAGDYTPAPWETKEEDKTKHLLKSSRSGDAQKVVTRKKTLSRKQGVKKEVKK